MANFFLYRIKVDRPIQRTLFDNSNESPGSIVLKAVLEKPVHELRKGQTWRIGNLNQLSKNEVFFAFGKITKSLVERYDEEHGDFLEESQEEAPYTYVALDLSIQVCAIAQKTKIAPTVGAIAKNLGKLLSESRIAYERNLSLSVSQINDPREFIELIRSAYRIPHFEITFSPPNPFDVEKQFHKPMELLLKASNGSKGKTALDGVSLDADILEGLTRSAAATGDDAKARIQSDQNSRPVTKSLHGNPVQVAEEDLASDEQKLTLMQRIREAYARIRGTEELE